MEESQYISHIHSGINVIEYASYAYECYIRLLKVLIHEKFDYPMMSLHGISVLPGGHITATLKPEVIISNDEIRGLKIRERGCLFDNEVVELFLM